MQYINLDIIIITVLLLQDKINLLYIKYIGNRKEW